VASPETRRARCIHFTSLFMYLIYGYMFFSRLNVLESRRVVASPENICITDVFNDSCIKRAESRSGRRDSF